MLFLSFIIPKKLSLILKYLNLFDVSEEATGPGTDILFPLFIASPIIVAYMKAVEWTSESFQDFLMTLSTWWNYSWITVETSNERINGTNNLSRTNSDNDIILTPML